MQADVWELLNHWHSDSVTSFLLRFPRLKAELSSNICANRWHMKKWLHRFPLVTFLYIVFDWSMTESSIKIVLYHSCGLPQISRSRLHWTSVSCCKYHSHICPVPSLNSEAASGDFISLGSFYVLIAWKQMRQCKWQMTTVKDFRRDEIFEGNEVIFVECCVTIAVYTNDMIS